MDVTQSKNVILLLGRPRALESHDSCLVSLVEMALVRQSIHRRPRPRYKGKRGGLGS